MTNIHAMYRKMERFLGYNPANEVRPDTKGALPEEVERSERIRGHYINPNPVSQETDEGMEIIGRVIFNHEKETIENIPFKGYSRKINGEEVVFEYKSRGRK